MIDFDTMRGAIVCGGRYYHNKARVYHVLDEAVERLGIQFIVQGAALGADYLAWAWADERGFPCGSFAADWSKHGKRAGPLRNQAMLDEAKPICVIAFSGGTGTEDMKRRARAKGIPVYEY